MGIVELIRRYRVHMTAYRLIKQAGSERAVADAVAAAKRDEFERRLDNLEEAALQAIDDLFDEFELPRDTRYSGGDKKAATAFMSDKAPSGALRRYGAHS